MSKRQAVWAPDSRKKQKQGVGPGLRGSPDAKQLKRGCVQSSLTCDGEAVTRIDSRALFLSPIYGSGCTS